MNAQDTDNDATIDRSKVSITDTKHDNFWLSGSVVPFPAYQYSAKVFDTGSEFGIEDGRISKLGVTAGETLVMRYDRGWDIKPSSTEQFDVLQTILDGFPEPHAEKRPMHYLTVRPFKADPDCAHWVCDGDSMELFVNGRAAAVVNNLLNAVEFTDPESRSLPNAPIKAILPLTDPVHLFTERSFPGIAPLPILRDAALFEERAYSGIASPQILKASDNAELVGKRLELKFNADYWKQKDYLALSSVPAATHLVNLATRALHLADDNNASVNALETHSLCCDVQRTLRNHERIKDDPRPLRNTAVVLQGIGQELQFDVSAIQEPHSASISAATPLAHYRAAQFCLRASEHLNERANRLTLRHAVQEAIDRERSRPEFPAPTHFFDNKNGRSR